MIFQTELTTLDSQINQLLAQVEVVRQKQAELTELDALTDSSLTQLKDVVSKIGHYDKSAIASLKSAVLTLFDPGDHGGNQPIDPTPDDDPTSGCDPEADDFDLIFLNGETGDCLTTDDAGIAKLTYAQLIKRRCSACWGYEVASKGDIKAGFINRANLNFMEAVNLERSGQEFYKTVEAYLDRLYYTGQACDIDKAPLTGQACDWASPFASPLSSVLWEDAPLNGQYCTITPSATEDNENKGTGEGEAMPYVQFVEVSEKVGYIKVSHSGEIKATYAGFTRKDRAEAWGRLLAMTYSIASGFEVRPAKHLPFKWELKLWDMNINQIQKFASEDLTKSPRVEVNSAKPPAREPVVLDADRVVVGQRIKTKDGQILEISSTLSADNRFFAKNANEQRQLIELDNVAEFLPTESPAQVAGIEPPSGWRQVQQQEQPITPGALVRHCVDAKFNIFQYGILQKTSSSEAEVWFEQDGVSKKVDLATIELIATDPQYAKVLAGVWAGKNFVVVQVSKANQGYTLLTPKGTIWFRADGVEILGSGSAETSEPEQAELPIYQRSDGGFEVTQSIKENASILQIGDIVEVTGTRHPQHFGLVGTVEALNNFFELPISVRTPRGLKGYLRSDLKLVSKGDKPQSQALQSGQQLMGDRIVTSGKYIGEGRVSQLLSAKLGTTDKIATIQLAKDLKNLGFDPRLAATVMAGVDDASDF